LKMASNKRQRVTDDQASSPTRTRIKLDPFLAAKLGMKYCDEAELTPLLLAKGLGSRIETFQVKATLIGDEKWMNIDLDSDNATAAELKEQIEQQSGKPANQLELFNYIEGWGRGISGDASNAAAATFLLGATVFDGPCSVMVSVNEAVDIILEGDARCEGLYERVEGHSCHGRGVWKKPGDVALYLFYAKSVDTMDHTEYSEEHGEWTSHQEVDVSGWMVSNECHGRPPYEWGQGYGWLYVVSDCTSPEAIEEQWYSSSDSQWGEATVRTRVCDSVEKHSILEMGHTALTQAQLMQTLVVTGSGKNGTLNECMGLYELMPGKVVNGRGVWKKKSTSEGGGGMFVFYHCVRQVNCVEEPNDYDGELTVKYRDDEDYCERALTMIAPGSMDKIACSDENRVRLYENTGGDRHGGLIAAIDPHTKSQWTISTKSHLEIAETGLKDFDHEELPKMSLCSAALTPVEDGAWSADDGTTHNGRRYLRQDRSLHVVPCETTQLPSPGLLRYWSRHKQLVYL
jgi:hypothetical protein